jgi:uncharacterized protein YndB with AHSA1/START domain
MMDPTEPPEIERSIEVEATPEEVWDRIVEGHLAEEWLGVTVEPRPGGAVTVPGSDTIGTVEEVERGHSITWSWRQVDGDPSQVTIDVEPAVGGGSRVTVTERILEYKITGSPPVFLSRAA